MHEEELTQTGRPSFGNIRGFLWGLAVDLALVALYFLSIIVMALAYHHCDSCTWAQHARESVVLGLKVGAGLLLAFTIYFWFLFIPLAGALLLTPPVVGLVRDCRRATRPRE